MVFWLKLMLWLAVLLLPGGVLLLPVIYAVHRRGAPAPTVTPDVTRDATPPT